MRPGKDETVSRSLLKTEDLKTLEILAVDLLYLADDPIFET